MSEPPSPGLSALLVALRNNPAVPEGWDAVLSLSESAVQSLVRSNYAGASQTTAGRSLLWVSPDQVNGHHDVVQVKADLPAPAVSLSVSDQAAHVNFGIDSATLQSGKAPAAVVSRLADSHAVVASGAVAWSDPVAITQQNPLQLSGSIPVAVAAAADNRSFSIGLSLADGHLTLSSQQVGIANQAVKQNVQKWLAASGQIGNLKVRDGAAATVLTPASVKTRVAAAVGGQPVLQILTGSSPGAAAPAASAPAPHPFPHDYCLIVSSKATMTTIANGYNLGTGNIKLVSVPPQDGQVHWFAEVHEPMVFEGRFGNQQGETYVTDHAKLYMRFGGSTDQGLQLFTYVDPGSTIQLQLELAAHYPIGISGTGVDQNIGLQNGAQSVTANGFYEAIVQPQLEAFLNGDIKSDMSKVRMTAISDLILRDLTLSGHQMQFDVAALPAELVIAGALIPSA